MGFTALDGLPMGTRSGQIDPGVVLHLQMQEGFLVMEVQDLLYRECGLKGLSGISNDVRDLEASADPRAAFALDHFANRSAMSTGSLAVAMGGLDGLVFTGSVGEHSVKARGAIGRQLGLLGITIDATKNAAAVPCISSPDSLPVLVKATEEELTIARHTLGVVHCDGEASNDTSSPRHILNSLFCEHRVPEVARYAPPSLGLGLQLVSSLVWPIMCFRLVSRPSALVRLVGSDTEQSPKPVTSHDHAHQHHQCQYEKHRPDCPRGLEQR